MNISRRQWLKQGTAAAIGFGFSLRSLGNEEGITRDFGRPAGLINLGANENPYGISPKAKEVIKALIGEANRYQYNVPAVQSFKKTLAAYHKVTTDHILITAGSGDGLAMLARQYSHGNIVTATPTFNILPATAKSIGAQVIEIPLTEDKVHDLPAMMNAINDKTSLVYICNPANPTATMLKPDVMKDFCLEASKKTTVLIDEAYIDFLDAPDNESMTALAGINPNIIVISTFSKIHGMAGLRIGYTISHPDTIKKLNEGHYSRSQLACSVLSLGAAQASLADEQHRRMSKAKNEAVREYTFQELRKMKFTCYPSFTNFLFFRLHNYKGDFASDMLKENILLRSNHYPDGQWARVSIGTMEEMKEFIRIMKNKFTA